MKRVLTAMVGAGLLAVTGCNPSTPTPSPTPAAVMGGTLTLGVWQEPGSLLDAGIIGALPFAYAIDAPVQEGLLWYRSVAETKHAASAADYWAPGLATETPTTANGDVKTTGCDDAQAAMCVTWKLRQGVQWQDGSSFTSHDVCDTYQLFWLEYGAQKHANPTPVASAAGWDQVRSCTEADRFTVVVNFKTQYGGYLTLGSGVYGIVPATFLDPAFAQAANADSLPATVDLTKGSGNPAAFHGQAALKGALDGTGPFVLQSYTPGDSIVLVANKHYWNPNQQPHLDKLIFKVEPDLATEVRDALSGAIQVGLDMRLANLAALQSAPTGATGITVQTIAASGAEKLDFNLCAGHRPLCEDPGLTANPYTADLTIRKAVLLGIDRAAIVQAVAPGRTVVPKDSWMYLGAAYLASAGVSQTAFDAQAANAMLDSAGYVRDAKCGAAPDGQPYRHWKDGTCIVVGIATTSDDPSRLKVETMVQTDLQHIGINVPSAFAGNAKSTAFFDTYTHGGPLYTHAFDVAMFALTLDQPGYPGTYFADYHGDCGGTCAADVQIPSSANGGVGLNDIGVSDAQLDTALDKARNTADLTQQARYYMQAEQRLAALLPEIPLFQQLIVNSYPTVLHGVKDNDIIWDYNTADWYCSAGPSGRGNCQA